MKTKKRKGREIFVICRIEQSQNAFRDQFEISRPGFIVHEVIKLTVVARRTVPSEFNEKEKHKNAGIKAKSSAGEIFFCNWDTYPNSMTPQYYWYSKTRTSGEFVDAVQGLNFGKNSQMPWVTSDGKKAEIPGVKSCPAHKIYHRTDEKCHKCHFDQLDRKKH